MAHKKEDITHGNNDGMDHEIEYITHGNNDEMAHDITQDTIATPPTTQSDELTHYETDLTHNNRHTAHETESIGNVQEEDLREEESSENMSLNTGNNKEENTEANLSHKRETEENARASTSSDGLQPKSILETSVMQQINDMPKKRTAILPPANRDYIEIEDETRLQHEEPSLEPTAGNILTNRRP